MQATVACLIVLPRQAWPLHPLPRYKGLQAVGQSHGMAQSAMRHRVGPELEASPEVQGQSETVEGPDP